jgi:hypothetical protein
MYLAFFRHKNNKHLVAFHLRRHFDVGDVGQIVAQLGQKIGAELAVRHFAAAKGDGGANLVAAVDPSARSLHSITVIVVVGRRSKLDFFDRNRDLFFLRFGGFLFLLVEKLAVIDDFADRRFGVRRNFDQILSFVARSLNGVARIHHADLPAVFVDDADGRNANPLVGAVQRASKAIGTIFVKFTSDTLSPFLRVESLESEV